MQVVFACLPRESGATPSDEGALPPVDSGIRIRPLGYQEALAGGRAEVAEQGPRVRKGMNLEMRRLLSRVPSSVAN